MSSAFRKSLPWLVFAALAVVILVFGNRSVQDATMQDYDAEYTEYHVNYLEKEVARLRDQNRSLRQELATVDVKD
jgi:hypothetical protein